MEFGVDGGGDRGLTFEQGRGGSIQVFIGNAVDAGVTDGAKTLPISLSDDAVERNAVAGAAPSEEQNVGIGCSHYFGRGVRAGCAQESAAGGFNQLSYPVLRVDQRLAPFFAINQRTLGWR